MTINQAKGVVEMTRRVGREASGLQRTPSRRYALRERANPMTGGTESWPVEIIAEASHDAESVLRICRAYDSLGTVAEQIGDVIGDVIEDLSPNTIAQQNPNALRLADERFVSAVAEVAREDGDDELLEEVQELRSAAGARGNVGSESRWETPGRSRTSDRPFSSAYSASSLVTGWCRP